MPRISLVLTVALLSGACDLDLNFSPFSDLNTGARAGLDGGPAVLPDGGIEMGLVVCGEPGQLHQAGFSYVDCVHSGVVLSPFGEPVGVGASATIFVDSPLQAVDTIASTDPAVATFQLASTDGGIVVLATGVDAGTASLELFDSTSTLIDEASVSVVPALGTVFVGGPATTNVALLSGATTTVCATPLQLAAAGDSVLADALVAMIGPQLIDVATAGSVSVTPVSPLGIEPLSTSFGVAMGNCFSASTTSGIGTLAVIGPGAGQAWQLTGVTPAEVTSIVSSPSTVEMQRNGGVTLTVTILAGGLPVVGASCDWDAPAGITVNEIQTGPMLGAGSNTTAYDVGTASGFVAGNFSITCRIDGGTASLAVPVAVH